MPIQLSFQPRQNRTLGSITQTAMVWECCEAASILHLELVDRVFPEFQKWIDGTHEESICESWVEALEEQSNIQKYITETDQCIGEANVLLITHGQDKELARVVNKYIELQTDILEIYQQSRDLCQQWGKGNG